MKWSGEHQAWEILSGLESGDIQTRAHVVFNPHTAAYELTCLGQGIAVSLRMREITGDSPLGSFLVNELGGYARLSILRYLIHAHEVPLTGRLVRPSDLPGGDIFSRGTHVLPLDKLAGRFGSNLQGFLNIGRVLGSSQLEYGDASVTLSPFPRVPVVIIVWSGDTEFQSKASLLFDSSCVSHLSTDILWSTAMMSLEMMLISESASNGTGP